MNVAEAGTLSAMLTGATPGWTPEATQMLLREIYSWEDAAAAQTAITKLCRSWTQSFRPALGVVVEAYQIEVARRRATAPALPKAPDGAIAPSEGRRVALAAYQRQVHLEGNEAVERFDAAIGGRSTWSSFVETTAPDDELGRAWAAIGQGAQYVEVLRAFGGDHLRAGRALRNLERNGAITHRINGWITPREGAAEVGNEQTPLRDPHPS